MSKKLKQKAPRNIEDINEKIEHLYGTYHGLVRYFSNKMFHGMRREDFEDRFWMRIYEMVREGRFESVKNERSYFYGILKRVYWEQLQKNMTLLKTVDVACLSDSIQSKLHSSEEVILKKELAEDIIKYVNTLQLPLPEIFNYYFIKGRNSRWIAHKMHINWNTIRSQLRKIRISVKERFDDCL